ncbi:MAG: hypothetical protein OWU32_05580 [Firmicutes bacterium]|nr:hypothetical protein [Bacillota bacterium]
MTMQRRIMVGIVVIALALVGGIVVDRVSLSSSTLPQADAPPVVRGWVQVATASELEYVDENQSRYLKDDIRIETSLDLAGFSWVPLGGNGMAPYSGHLDGEGHEITGWHVSDSSGSDVGFIGASVGSLDSLSVSGTVTGGSQFAGGLVGRQQGGRIVNASSAGSVSGPIEGGLVGALIDSHLGNSRSSAAVGGGDALAGGLVGVLHGGEISNCVATGTVKASGVTGGLVGSRESGRITNSRFDAKSAAKGVGQGSQAGVASAR